MGRGTGEELSREKTTCQALFGLGSVNKKPKKERRSKTCRISETDLQMQKPAAFLGPKLKPNHPYEVVFTHMFATVYIYSLEHWLLCFF